MSRVQTAAASPIGRVVRDLERVIFVVERDHRRDRAEDFFAREPRALFIVVKKYGRLLHSSRLAHWYQPPSTKASLASFLPSC